MNHVYFVRHGESEWNVANKICGRTDIPLTEKGHEQAIQTAKKILEEEIVFDEILTSPLMRAKETARHISEITNVPMRIEQRLIEQHFGRFEGTPRDGEEFKKAKQNFISRYDGGESMMEVAHRIYSLLDDIKEEDKTYLLVAHNGIARILKSYFEDMSNEEFAQFGVKNCEIVRFDFLDK